MKKQWRSVEDFNSEPSAKTFLHREFQEGASFLEEGVSRRSFLKFMGGTAALAGLSGCVTSIRKPTVKIYPYARKLEHIVPGNPTFYASTFVLNGDVAGVLVETHEGRPTKIEGNPNHPTSLGSSTVFQQASVLDLYDPDRLQTPLHEAKLSSLSAFKDWMLIKRKEWSVNQGQGLCFLIEDTASPVFNNLLSAVYAKYPKATIRQFSALSNHNSLDAIQELSGQRLAKMYNFDKATIIVNFDEDFLGVTTNQILNTKGFSSRRDPELGNLNRLYTFETRVSITGSKSDHRYPVKQSEMFSIASALLYHVAKLLKYDLSTLGVPVKSEIDLTYVDTKTIKEIASDLYHNRSHSLVTVGDHLSSDVHKLVLIMNDLLLNNFSTLTYHQLSDVSMSHKKNNSVESLTLLVEDLNAGKVDTLVILADNPVYAAPYDLNFEKAIAKAKDRVHLTSIQNETSSVCNWVLPKSHYLESWGDAQTVDGVQSLIQPVIKKMYDSINSIEVLNLSFDSYASDYSLTRQYWMKSLSEEAWKKALHDGVLSRSSNQASFKIINQSLSFKSLETAPKESAIEVFFFPDYGVFDGSLANNSWLQELPDPIHKLTWDNAAFMAPKTAKKLGLKTGDIVSIQASGASIEIPVFISPGHAFDSISIPIGYGRKVGGKVSEGVGVSVYPIRSVKEYDYLKSVTLLKTKKSHSFASTQDHGQMEGRPHFRYATLNEYEQNPNFANEKVEVPFDKSLWPDHSYDEGYQWGMVIDLNKCTSCNTCITSCQAENNIPVAGKDQVQNGREMHWIRVDRYYEGDIDNPDLISQPVTCLHCENAPCEQVCPVAATVHDNEGLNVMVYNRCVGTRYCSDNCPVKVRRFNFFDYHQRSPHATKKDKFHLFDYVKEPDKNLQKQFNPDVTVRMRGVMEKCTYCIQRIKAGSQHAKNENRVLLEGEVVSACQQACPAGAIVMGNINDPNSKVSKLRKKQRNYSILEQLLLRARTTYLAAVYNPNPNLVDAKEYNHKSEAKHVSHAG